MNCHYCKDTGIYSPAGEPDEICTCVDAWAKSPERRVIDLGEAGPFGDCLRTSLIESLPKGAEWDRRDNALSIAGLGGFYFDERASIASVIIAAKALTKIPT